MSQGCLQPLLISRFDTHWMLRARAVAVPRLWLCPGWQPPAVLPEQQQLTGSVQGGHHPPAGFHRQHRVRCRAHSDDKQLTHPQRCRCFQKPVPLAEVWFVPFSFAPSASIAERGRAGAAGLGRLPWALPAHPG